MDADQTPTSLTQAWAVALLAIGLTAYIGVAAVVGNAPGGDRPGGVLLCILAALAVSALALTRRRPDVLARTLGAIGLGQVAVAAVMIGQHWGASAVILAINGILLACWLLAAGLFYHASRVPGAEH
jgi:uncharacterized membrane protein